MADNPFSMFDSATPSSGGSAGAPAQPTQSTGSNKVNPFSMFDTTGPSAEEQAYKEKIRKAGPAAEKFVKEQGTSGAFSAGVGESIPFLSPLVQSGARAVAAGLGKGGEGSFSERYENLKAMDEAVRQERLKQHPIAQTAGTIGGSLVLPVGGIAGKLGTMAESANLGKVGTSAAEIAGVGAEAGLYGGATALGEKALGTAPESEKPSILGSTLEGAGIGVGLGAAGKGISAGFSRFAPEWMKGLGNKDAYQMNKFAENWHKDEINGSAKMTRAEYNQAIERGQPITLLDVGGTDTKEWLRKAFRNNQNALEEFSIKAGERLANEGQRFEDFLAKHAGFEESINQDQIRQQAKNLAEATNERNYGRAAWLPENGRGTWKDSWMTHFDDPDVQHAFSIADSTMKRKYGDAYTSPLSTMADQSVDKLAESGLNNKTIQTLKNAGIETIGDLTKLKSAELAEALQVMPKTSSHQARSAAERQTNRLVDEVSGTLKKVNPEEFVIDPQKVNVEFLDRWQRQLELNAKKLEDTKPELYMDFVKRLRDLKGDILGSLKSPKSPFYNEAFDVAHTQAAQFHRENDAFTAGQKMLSSLASNQKTSEIANATANMTPQEKDFFVKGILGQMTQTGLRGGNINYQQLKNWLNRPDVTRALNNTLGEAKFNDLRTFLKAEVAMGDAAKEAARYGSSDRDWRGWVPTALAFYIEQKAGISMLVYRAADYYMGRKFATSLAEKMLSSDSSKVEEVLDTINKNPKVKSFFNSLMARALVAGNIEDSQRAGVGPQARAAGGAVHMQDGGVPPRQLDERGQYSEAAETARKILPKAQGNAANFVQRLLGKGVKPDELHHTKIEGIPLRHRDTGELHPRLQGDIGGHELADLIEKHAPQLDRIHRTSSSNQYKPAYDMKSQKLPFSTDYSELNIAGKETPTDNMFVPPKEDIRIFPRGQYAHPALKEPAAQDINTSYMPIDENNPVLHDAWRARHLSNVHNNPLGYSAYDRFGNYISNGYLEGNPLENMGKAKEEIRGEYSHKARGINPVMAHFSDVPNLAYHSRLSHMALQKDNKYVKNLNIEEAQSDAARRHDENARSAFPSNPVTYNRGTHEALYNAAVEAQEKLRDPSIPWYEHRLEPINNYNAYHSSIFNPNVPDVPYLESNKSWQRALAKDILHHAAKEGYESITVTPWQEIVRRAKHSKPVDQLEIQGMGSKRSNISSWDSQEPELFHVKGLPMPITMDDLKKIYGNEIEPRIRKTLPEGKRGSVTLQDDSYAKKPFYAFIPSHNDLNLEDEDNVQQFLADIIDSGKKTRRKAEVHNAFIKQLQNVINEEHDPHFKIDYEHSDKYTGYPFQSAHDRGEKLVAPGAFLSPELRESILKKGFKRFKKGGYVTENLTRPIDPSRKFAFGGSANTMRLVNNSVHMPKPGDPDFVGPTMTNSSYDPNKSGVFDRLNMFGDKNIHWTPDLGHVASRGYRIDKTGRTQRSTGGRIPEADKLFKQAKKYVDSHTKHLLDVPDDAIVKALRVAQKKV